jgi:hypothetical protein
MPYQYPVAFVTNFYDINRGDWNHWQRTSDTYMECFRVLARVRVPLIVYIHDTHYERARDICAEERSGSGSGSGSYPPLTLVPYNEAFLKEHIRSWSYLETEAGIMSTEQYREWTRARSTCPETHNPKYNCINHAKIDFVRHAMQHGGFVTDDTQYPYYGWVDFGYLKPDEVGRTFPPNGVYVPNLADRRMFDPNKVTLVVNVVPEPARCRDPVQTLIRAPEWFTGGFWVGGRCALMRYWEQYHAALQEMYAANVADDDQAVMSMMVGTIRDPATPTPTPTTTTIQLLKNHLLPTAGWATGFMLTNLPPHEQNK